MQKILLQTNKTNVEKDLYMVCEFIGKVLDYVATSKKKSFDSNDFKSVFKRFGVDWFVNYRSIEKGLSELFKLKTNERKLILDVYREDIEFYKHLDENDYRIKFPTLPDNIKAVAKPFFESLYDEILGGSTGFRMKGLAIPKLRREHVRKGYFEANRKPNYKLNSVCPACLGAIGVTNDDGYADLDHYLTKSIYPNLSLSPDNLIPLCKECNEDTKRAVDPLKEHHGSGELLNIFIPYYRPGIGSINIKFDRDGLNEKIIIVAEKGKEAESIRVSNFESLFQLNNRWSGKINSSLYDSIISELVTEFSDRYGQIDEKAFKEKLNKMYISSERVQLTVPDAYLKAQYIKNLIINSDMFVGLYKEITETTAEQNDIDRLFKVQDKVSVGIPKRIQGLTAPIIKQKEHEKSGNKS